jgi:hypothetical protein
METFKPAKPANFRLTKLYLDCIDEHGNCFIAYRAKLKFHLLTFYYSALIFSDRHGVTFEKSSRRKNPDPVIKDLLIFYDHYLHFKGAWHKSDSPLPPLTFSDEMNNELEWYCHHPGALTEVMFNENLYKGYGYAETLSLTIKPQNLPMDELKWGRFLSREYTITWINWKGLHPLNKIYCNGVEYNDAIPDHEKLVFGEGAFTLNFEKISTIRNGRLSDVLARMPVLKLISGSRILNSTEIKYKAQSTLRRNSEIVAEGWALYETVIWKK